MKLSNCWRKDIIPVSYSVAGFMHLMYVRVIINPLHPRDSIVVVYLYACPDEISFSTFITPAGIVPTIYMGRLLGFQHTDLAKNV